MTGTTNKGWMSVAIFEVFSDSGELQFPGNCLHRIYIDQRSPEEQAVADQLVAKEAAT